MIINVNMNLIKNSVEQWWPLLRFLTAKPAFGKSVNL